MVEFVNEGCGWQELHLYLDYKLDESYTPNKIAVRAGNSFYDLKVCTAQVIR